MIQRNDETNLPAPKPCRRSRGKEAAEEGGTVAEDPAHSIHHDAQNHINQSKTRRIIGKSKVETRRVKMDNKTQHRR